MWHLPHQESHGHHLARRWTAVFVLSRVFPRVRLDHLPPALASSLSQTKTSIVTNGRRSCSGSGIGQHGGYSHCLQSCWQVYCHPLSCCHVRSFVFQREYLEVIPGITCGTNGNVTLLTTPSALLLMRISELANCSVYC